MNNTKTPVTVPIDLAVDSGVNVETSIIRYFPFSNLNSDDQGTPKTGTCGDVVRQRISSQCWKRMIRMSREFVREVGVEEVGIRTMLIPAIVAERLREKSVPQNTIDGMVAVMASIGKKDKKDDEDGEESTGDEDDAKSSEPKTRHGIFTNQSQIQAVTSFVLANQAVFAGVFEEKKAKKEGKSGDRKVNVVRVAELRKNLADHLASLNLRPSAAAAMSGSFITGKDTGDTVFANVDASYQQACPISTHAATIESDYGSMKDDIATGPGAAYLGETESCSSTFYIYSNCKFDALIKNLHGDVPLAIRAIRGMVHASARATPSGRQNSTAPHTPADYVEVVLRRASPINLAGAFVEPVAWVQGHDVVEQSVTRLRSFSDRYEKAYSEPGDVLGRFIFAARDFPGLPQGTYTDLGDMLDALGSALASLGGPTTASGGR